MKFEITIEGKEPYIVECESIAHLDYDGLVPSEACTIRRIEE